MGLVGRFSNLNAQYHILSYLGPVWGCFDCVGHMDDCPECVPRFNDTQVRCLLTRLDPSVAADGCVDPVTARLIRSSDGLMTTR